ncbi:MAG: HAD family phosphatase [Blastocatellales bacterium]|nr:HAD family phosphatase [Blastocatellales bacterium]
MSRGSRGFGRFAFPHGLRWVIVYGMAIRLLALDIDGTLLNSRGEITPRVREALDEVQRRGILVALVTGRRFGSARPVAEDLGLPVPLISHNGALTKHVSTLETIGFHPLDRETAREVVGIGRAYGVDMVCNDDPDGLGVLVTEGVSADNRALHRYLDKYRDSVVEVPDLLEYLDHAPIQIMFSGRCDPIDDFASELEGATQGRLQLFRTRYRSVDLTILDALSAAASKGASIEEVASAYDIAREEIMAIGDNHNDLSMLGRAGLGVVMGNAEDELRAMGFAITTSNEEDGVAVAVERYILEASESG